MNVCSSDHNISHETGLDTSSGNSIASLGESSISLQESNPNDSQSINTSSVNSHSHSHSSTTMTSIDKRSINSHHRVNHNPHHQSESSDIDR